MRVPQSPHNLRKFVPSTSSSDSDSEPEKQVKKTNFSKKKELSATNEQKIPHQRGRERTRISAVQRLVERKMAQKEKEQKKERDQFLRRSSSVGSSNHDQIVKDLKDSKTYITISSGKPTRIREISPVKQAKSEILHKPLKPLKSTEIFKDLHQETKKVEEPPAPQRKISFTSEKTIMINNTDTAKPPKPNGRKVSIDINYVFETQTQSSTVIQDEKLKMEKRRVSLEKRFKERSSSLSSMSTSSTESETPEPAPRQSKQRRMSGMTTRNINIILEDEISNESPKVVHNLPKAKASYQRRFSQDHSNKTSLHQPTLRKISLQNTTTINTDSLADQKKEEGNQLYLSKNYREALQRYNEAISLCPGCPAFYGNRAACHIMLGQFIQALEDARTSVQLDPNFVKGYIRVAKCCVALGQVHEAKQAIKTAFEKDPTVNVDLEKTSLDFLDKHDSNLKVAFKQADFRKALYHIEQALQIASASSRLKLSRAECLAFLGRYQEAQEVANDLLRSDSTNIEAIYLRGLCLYYEDNIDKAFTHFQQVLKLAPDHAKAKEAFKRARQLKSKKDEGNEAFKANKFEEALKLYSEALTVDADNKMTNAKLYFNRATVLAKLRRFEKSVEDCNSALNLDDSYAKAYLRRAKSFMEMEKFEEAVRDYERLHKMDRSNFEYRQCLNQAKLELKKSLRKDFYKILGVDKHANEEDIKKAYKKRAMEHHPDRHAGATDEEKKEHERKFKEIGEAYSVLSDARKKARFDAGQDLDSNSGSGEYHYSSSFSHQQMDPAQMFKAFFGGNAGMHNAFHHHFGFGSKNNMPGAFFQFT